MLAGYRTLPPIRARRTPQPGTGTRPEASPPADRSRPSATRAGVRRGPPFGPAAPADDHAGRDGDRRGRTRVDARGAAPPGARRTPLRAGPAGPRRGRALADPRRRGRERPVPPGTAGPPERRGPGARRGPGGARGRRLPGRGGQRGGGGVPPVGGRRGDEPRGRDGRLGAAGGRHRTRAGTRREPRPPVRAAGQLLPVLPRPRRCGGGGRRPAGGVRRPVRRRRRRTGRRPAVRPRHARQRRPRQRGPAVAERPTPRPFYRRAQASAGWRSTPRRSRTTTSRPSGTSTSWRWPHPATSPR